WTGAAHAQMSSADLVTRIDRLQAQVRELTGTVEELQYRNQQLEQEVQRLRAAPGAAAATAPTAQSPPPPSPRYSSPQYPPPAPLNARGRHPLPPPPPPTAGRERIRAGTGPAPASFERRECVGGAARRCVRSGSQSDRARCAAATRRQHRRQRAAAAGGYHRGTTGARCAARSFETVGVATGKRRPTGGRGPAAAPQTPRPRPPARRPPPT